MKTAGRVSDLAGASVRTLRYYDKIGPLSPSSRSDTDYRLYSDGDLGRLQQIPLFRELGFSLEADAAVRAVRRDGERRRQVVSMGFDGVAEAIRSADMRMYRAKAAHCCQLGLR